MDDDEEQEEEEDKPEVKERGKGRGEKMGKDKKDGGKAERRVTKET